MHKTEMELRELFPAHLSDVFIEWHPVGSRYICDPSPMDTDIDFICLSGGRDPEIDDWKAEGSRPQGELVESFVSYRKGSINLIITESKSYYDAFVRSANVCREFNIRNKDDRINVHQAILRALGEIS